MTRTTFQTRGHRRWPISVTHRHGVRTGDLAVVGGMIDIGPSGTAGHEGDAPAQAAVAVAAVGRVLAGLDLGLRAVVKIQAQYVAGSAPEDDLRAAIATALPQGVTPALTLVPVPLLERGDALVEVDAIASAVAERTHVGDRGPFADAVRAGDHVLVGAQTVAEVAGGIAVQSEVVLDRLRWIVGELGCELDDAVKVNIFYVGDGTAEDWEVAARVRGAAFTEPAAAATGIPVPTLGDPRALIAIDLWAMRSVDGRTLPRKHGWPPGHWDWPIHLPWKHACRCEDVVHVGGQVSLRGFGEVVDAGDIRKQTRTAMRNIAAALAEVGAGLEDIVRLTAFYEAGAEPGHACLEIISSSFHGDGPAITLVPLPCLAYRGMVVEIEAVAVVG